MVDKKSLKVFSEALREGILLWRYGIPRETFHYGNWEGTLAEELSLDGILLQPGRPDPTRPLHSRKLWPHARVANKVGLDENVLGLFRFAISFKRY